MSATNRGAERQPNDYYATPEWATRAILPHLAVEGSVVFDPCAGDGAILSAVRGWTEVHHRPGVRPPRACGLEIDPRRAARARERGFAVTQGDALALETRWRAAQPAPLGLPARERLEKKERVLVLTNPPYASALTFVTRALIENPDGESAMLLRLGFLESKERRAFHERHPSDLYVLSSRPECVASLKCKRACGWREVREIEAPRPLRCPICVQAGITVTTTDASAYAWFVWGPGRGGRWRGV